MNEYLEKRQKLETKFPWELSLINIYELKLCIRDLAQEIDLEFTWLVGNQGQLIAIGK